MALRSASARPLGRPELNSFGDHRRLAPWIMGPGRGAGQPAQRFGGASNPGPPPLQLAPSRLLSPRGLLLRASATSTAAAKPKLRAEPASAGRACMPSFRNTPCASLSVRAQGVHAASRCAQTWAATGRQNMRVCAAPRTAGAGGADDEPSYRPVRSSDPGFFIREGNAKLVHYLKHRPSSIIVLMGPAGCGKSVSVSTPSTTLCAMPAMFAPLEQQVKKCMWHVCRRRRCSPT